MLRRIILSCCIWLLPYWLGLYVGLANASKLGLPRVDRTQINTPVYDLSASTANKRDQKVNETPDVIDIITAEDIRKFGANNLLDVFNRMPSIQTSATSFAPNNIVALRGKSFQHHTTMVLFLIDGRPYRDSAMGMYGPDLFLNFPLELVARIEFVRGANSTLYGGGAYSGVINIITHKEAKQFNQLTLSAGPNNTDQFSGALRLLARENAGVVLAWKQMNSDGWNYWSYDKNQRFGSFRREEENFGLTINGYWQNFRLSSFISETNQVTLGRDLEFEGEAKEDTFGTKRKYVDFSYAKQLNSKWGANANVTYNRLGVAHAEAIQVSQSDPIFNAYQIEASVHGIIDKRSNVVVGFSKQYNDVKFEDVNRKTDSSHAYLQYNYLLGGGLGVYAGVEFSDASHLQFSSAPKFGLVKKLASKWTLKFTHGNAYRSPYLFETSYSDTFLAGNPQLQRESVTTTNVQLLRDELKKTYSFTIYHSKLKKLISYVGPEHEQYPEYSLDSSLPAPINRGGHTFVGLEFDIKYQLSSETRLVASANFKLNEDESGVSSAITPEIMAKGGVIYEPKRRHYTMAFFNSHFGDPARTSEIYGAKPLNLEAEAYNLLSFKFAYRNPKKPNGFKAALFIENLLSNRVYFPDVNNRQINTLPLYPGARLYVVGTYRF